MANQEHVELLKQGVAQWNEWREQHPQIQPDLRGADLSRANPSDAYRTPADFASVNLRKADLSNADLSFANLSQADLSQANFRQTCLEHADLSNANLMDADLSRALLLCADLKQANLRETNLNGTDLSGTDLSFANLGSANLGSADLRGADLGRAFLCYANLRKADLRKAHLYYKTDLTGADLREANLSSAIVGSTIFADLDLRETRGLAEIQHAGPSNIQLHTVQLPQDSNAIHFLRGAGVPDEYINLWRTTMMYPIQYHSLFISYSSKDDMLAHRLHADLQDHGVRCWFAPEDMKIGDEIRSRNDEAINLQEKLLLLLSEHSLASTWVKNEVEAAFEKEEKQQRLVLFPVRLDESVEQTTKSWATTLCRTRHIGNFTRWTDPQEYQQAFERLLRDLKKADERQDQEMTQ